MRTFKLIIASFLILSLYINYSVYDSWVLFEKILTDFNSNKYSELNYRKLLKQDTTFASLSPTAVCIDDLTARYEFLFGQKQKSLEIIDGHKCSNPHWGIRELIKSEIFYNLKVEDSANYYAEKAFKILPNNILHFESYLKVLNRNQEYNKMVELFKNEQIKKTSNHYMLFLANYNAEEGDLNKGFIDSVAILSKNLFPQNDKINLYADNQLLKKEALIESIKFSKVGNDFFKNKKYNEAINNYKKATDLNPYLYWCYENMAMSQIILQNYEEAIKSIDPILNSEINLSENGKAYYIKAVALVGLSVENNKEEICKLIKQSLNLKYEKALNLSYKYCN
jgi:tetratricopeptide (TPR) repeat protein